MALAHQIHRHSRSEDHEEDPYAGPDMAGVEVIAAGSVTSFVRKLFQMVQGECDSVVGFVADGTAFEVKDPRRLEQDILPKYFRHSRFQSLVRQLNFYSFKKISKERSVWIYKHAFFRRDEPELLHALKRKTNQHGAPGRIGGAGGGGGIVAGEGGDDAGLDRSMVPSNLSHDAHDNSGNKPRPRGPSLSRLPSNSSFSPPHHHQHHQHHHTSPSSFNNGSNGRHQNSSGGGGGRQLNHHQSHHHHQNPHQHHPHHEQQHQQHQQPSRPQQPLPAHHHQHHLSSPHHVGKGGSHLSSNSRGGSAGGGPSTGGVGGAAVPSYGGQGPSSRVPGFAWSGAGGRPVSAGGGASPDYAECAGNSSGNDSVHRGGRGGGWASSPNHHDSHNQHNNHHNSHNLRHHSGGGDGDESSAHRAAAMALAMAPSHGYRQGPAVGDTGGGDDDAGNDDDRHSGKRRTGGGGGSAATNAAAPAAVAAYAATSAAGAGASAGTDPSGRDQAPALWGLSALCQVASATEGPADTETRGDVRGRAGRSPRAGLESEDRHTKRPCVEDGVGGMRRGWGSAGGGGRRRGDGSSEEDEGEEDGITSAERDDSSASFHSRSPSSSSCGSSRSSNDNGGGSPRHSIPDHDHDGVVVTTSVGSGNEQAGGNDRDCVEGRREEGSTYTTSGSRGVFCPTWDWGRAAREPAIRLPGSFVDRRGGREGEAKRVEGREQALDQDAPAEGFEMEVEEDEESSKTEGEDMDDEEDHETLCVAKEVHERASAATSTVGTVASSASTSEGGGSDGTPAPPHSACPRPRDLQADIDAESAVGLEGIGAMFAQFSSGGDSDTAGNGNTSDFLATVTNSNDGGLREMAVFCAGPAGQAPDVASPASLARLVSSFLQSEADVAEDLRVYAEALDPAAVDVVVTGRAKPSPTKTKANVTTNTLADSMADPSADPKQNHRHPHEEGATNAAAAGLAAEAAVMETPAMGAQDGAKLLRVFCRYAACRLGRALEVASFASAPANATAPVGRSHDATAESQQKQEEELRFVARRVSPRLDECRWKWWRAAVRFS